MRSIIVLVACGLVACGTATGQVVSTCHNPCIGSLEFEYEARCEDVNKEIEIAKTILDKHGLVPEQDFCPTFKNVHVHAVATLLLTDGTQGNTFLNNIIVENRRMSLVHELLHYWDVAHFAIFTGSHDGWDKNGYKAADEDYIIAVDHLPRSRTWGFK